MQIWSTLSENEAGLERRMRMCSPISFLTEQGPERLQRLSLVLWKAFLVAQPCLAPAQFRLHTWHSEREANPRGQPHSGRARREGEGEKERREREREEGDRTGENQRKKGRNKLWAVTGK